MSPVSSRYAAQAIRRALGAAALAGPPSALRIRQDRTGLRVDVSVLLSRPSRAPLRVEGSYTAIGRLSEIDFEVDVAHPLAEFLTSAELRPVPGLSWGGWRFRVSAPD